MLTYEIVGKGPDVLLLHPVGLDGETWRAVAEPLSRVARIILVDLPGHGSSPHCVARPSLDDYADDVLRLITQLDLRSYVLIGLSLGGMIAQMIAVRSPAEMAAVVICGCPSTFPEEARNAIRQRGEKAVNEGMQAIVEETLGRWFTREFIASGDVAATRERLLSDNPAVWAAAWNAIAGLDVRARLGTVQIPVLCIAGECDLGSPPAVVRATADSIPGSEYAEIAGAPHMMQLERPAEFARLIAEFLARVEASRG